ncbi:MAG: hypothetical protein K1X47_08465 [Cyclobacteriaceae bacterium]|nr:hypothetical protein [Cyclobacteriaceae bacterium]
MKRIFAVLLVWSLLPSCVPALSQNLSSSARRNPYFTDLLNGMSFVRPESQVEGDPYLERHWNQSIITVYESKEPAAGYYTRYNLYTNTLEILMERGPVGLDVTRVNFLETKDSLSGVKKQFTNAREYTIDGIPMIGLVEVLVDGQVSLLRRTGLVITPPNYNAALNAGSRNTRITKTSELLYAFGADARKVKSRKKFFASFGKDSAWLEKYASDNKLSHDSERHLIALLTHYNETFGKQ